MAKNSSKDLAFKSGAQWLYQEMQQKLGDKPIEEVDPHIKAEATKLNANQYMVMMSIVNIKNSVREYYRDEHDTIMRFRDRESNVVTEKMFNKMKELGVI